MECQTCNMEIMNAELFLEDCGKPAIWHNPRWPTGKYCDDHKETLITFFSQ